MVREKKCLPKLCHIRKKNFGRLSKALLSILESSCYGSEKLSELYFLFWPLLMSGACHQFRPRKVVFYGCFQYKRSFLSQCWCKGTIFLSRKQEYGKKIRKKSVSIWFIAIYIKLNFAFNIFGKTKVGTILQNDTALERTFSTHYLFDFQIVITLKLLKQTQLFYIKIGKACILEK